VFHRRDFRPGKKGGSHVGKTKRGKGTKIMGVADAHGAPIALSVESASPAEVKLVSQTLRDRFTTALPKRLIGDKAYDSNPLDEEMRQLGIRMISPNREGTRRTQDGRELRRYKRRWKIERTFAWLAFSRRTVVRYERYVANFEAFLHLACFFTLFKLL
jgi:transposase